MKAAFRATFDGQAFRPKEPVDLPVDREYVVTVERVPRTEDGKSGDVERDPAFDLSDLAVHTGIPDLAHEHDHYLYGTPKRGDLDAG